MLRGLCSISFIETYGTELVIAFTRPRTLAELAPGILWSDAYSVRVGCLIPVSHRGVVAGLSLFAFPVPVPRH